MTASTTRLMVGSTIVNYNTMNRDSDSIRSATSTPAGSRSPSSTKYEEIRPRCLESRTTSLHRYFASEVDVLKVNPALVGYAFMTGYIDAISFSALFVWCGFQTGNFAQLALALARTIESQFLGPRVGVFEILSRLPQSVQQSACSLGAFLLGLLIFGRLGDRIGTHKRGWLFCGTLIQAALTLVSAFTAGWHVAGEQPQLVESSASLGSRIFPLPLQTFYTVACLSASLGIQGIMARRLGTQFSTTIVLTGVFVELATEPCFFQVTRCCRTRDQKWLAVIGIFFGVLVGRLLLGQMGTAATLAFGAAIRVGIAILWLYTPATYIHIP